MGFLDTVAKKLTKQEKIRFDELNDWVLVVFGIGAFLVSGYLGIMLNNVVPDYINAVNKVGFPPEALYLGVVIAFFGALVWFFGCITARCHILLYERWFK